MCIRDRNGIKRGDPQLNPVGQLLCKGWFAVYKDELITHTEACRILYDLAPEQSVDDAMLVRLNRLVNSPSNPPDQPFVIFIRQYIDPRLSYSRLAKLVRLSEI